MVFIFFPLLTFQIWTLFDGGKTARVALQKSCAQLEK